jgi:hypothetical protein
MGVMSPCRTATRRSSPAGHQDLRPVASGPRTQVRQRRGRGRNHNFVNSLFFYSRTRFLRILRHSVDSTLVLNFFIVRVLDLLKKFCKFF